MVTNPVIVRRIAQSVLMVALLSISACSDSESSLLKRADTLLASGQTEEAILAYRKVLQKNASSVLAHAGLARLAVKKREYLGAYRSYREASRLAPDNLALQEEFGRFCLRSYAQTDRPPAFLLDDARTIAKRLADSAKPTPGALALFGQVAMLDQRYSEAEAAFRKVLAVEPTAESKVGLLQSIALQGRKQEAESQARGFLQAQPEAMAIYDWLALFYTTERNLSAAEEVIRRKVVASKDDLAAVMELANFLYINQNPGEADSLLNRIAGEKARVPGTLLAVGDFYRTVGSTEKALQSFQNGLRDDGVNAARYRRRIAALFLKQGKRDEARSLLEQCIQQDPKDAEARRLMAKLSMGAGVAQDLKSSLDQLTQVVSLRPKDPIAHYDVGVAYWDLRRYREAQSHLQEAIRLRRRYVEAYLALSAMMTETRNWAESERLAVIASEIDKGDPLAAFLTASAQARQSKWVEARATFQRLARSPNSQKMAELQLANIDAAQGFDKRAEAVYRKHYRAGDSDLTAIRGLAALAIGRREFDVARQLLQKELAASRSKSSLLQMLAELEVGAGRLDAAKEFARQASAEDPGSVEALVLLAQVHAAQGDRSGSLTAASKAHQLSPSDPNAVVLYSSSLASANRLKEAIEVLRNGLAATGTNADIQNNLTYFLAESGELDQSVAAGQEALKAFPQFAELRDTMASVYLRKGDRTTALQMAASAVRLAPEASPYRIRYAKLLLEAGDKVRARAELDSAMRGRITPEVKAEIEGLRAKL